MQPTSKRLVTESTVGGHVATQINTPGSATATALSATLVPKSIASYPLQAKISAALAGGSLFRVGFAADSKTAGQGAGTPLGAWPTVLKRLLVAAGYPNGGTGMVYAHNGGTDPRWTFPAAWGPVGADKHGRASDVTAGSPAVLVSDQPGTIVEVMYYSMEGSNFTVTVDGGAPVTVTGVGGGSLALHTITGLPNTTHTISIQPLTVCYLQGAGVRQATGLVVDNSAISGTTAAQWADGSSSFGAAQVSGVTAPSLVFIALGTNDRGTSVAAFKANLVTIASRYPNASIIGVGTGPINEGGYDMAPYVAAVKEASAANGWGFIDLYALEQSWATANTNGLMSDNYHENAAGHALIARHVFDRVFRA